MEFSPGFDLSHEAKTPISSVYDGTLETWSPHGTTDHNVELTATPNRVTG